ncbi:hypothetical protein GF406_09105 [candidate division KSB1 bacterium]|nr:hypothetical protein [candidate division KSB1 bacterium]
MQRKVGQRDSHWSESVAVGNLQFLETMMGKLGYRAKGRSIRSTDNLNHKSDSLIKVECQHDIHALIGENLVEWDVSQKKF